MANLAWIGNFIWWVTVQSVHSTLFDNDLIESLRMYLEKIEVTDDEGDAKTIVIIE